MSVRIKKVLFLGYGQDRTPLIEVLEQNGCTVETSEDRVDDFSNFELVICFGYRHIIKKTTLENTRAPVINLHVSLLPWNRGAHPNFWSFFDDTPKGVTIHLIDENLDTGPILWQERVQFRGNQLTFAQTQLELIARVEKLFIRHIGQILNWDVRPIQQSEGGSFHKKSDLPKGFSGWNSIVDEEIRRLKQNPVG